MKSLFENIQPLIGHYKTIVPIGTQKKLISILNFLGGNRIWSRFHSPLYEFLVVGTEKYDSLPLRCSIVSSRLMANYLMSVFYKNNPIVTEVGRVHEREFGHAKSVFESDVSIYVVPSSYKNLFPYGFFSSLSTSVHVYLDLKTDEETILKRAHRTRRPNVRKIKICNCYSYEISHDIKDFNYFYSFYYSYINERHGISATPRSSDYLKSFFKKGGLLSVKAHGEIVSSLLFCPSGSTLYIPAIAFSRVQYDKFVEDTKGDALVHYLITWASRNGYSLLDNGICWSFLNDGSLRYKQSWGMKIEAEKEVSIFIRLHNFQNSVRTFLSGTPFIFYDGTDLKGYVFINCSHEVSDYEIEAAVKKLWVEGLKSLLILSTSGFILSSSQKFFNLLDRDNPPKEIAHFFEAAARDGLKMSCVEVSVNKVI